MNNIFLAAGIWPFSKPEQTIRTKIIFHASTLNLPERQQLGVATLSPAGFTLDIEGAGDLKPFGIAIPLDWITNLRVFQKKTYSSTFYVIQVDYMNDEGKPAMLAVEIRVFLRRGQALAVAKTWKELYDSLKS